MAKKMIFAAYRRNVHNACKVMGNRVPNGYTTNIAPNGDFIVRSAYEIVGRIPAGEYEVFFK